MLLVTAAVSVLSWVLTREAEPSVDSTVKIEPKWKNDETSLALSELMYNVSSGILISHWLCFTFFGWMIAVLIVARSLLLNDPLVMDWNSKSVFVHSSRTVHSVHSTLSPDHRYQPCGLWRKLQTPSVRNRSASSFLQLYPLIIQPLDSHSNIVLIPTPLLHCSLAPDCVPFDVVCLDCRCSFILWNLWG